MSNLTNEQKARVFAMYSEGNVKYSPYAESGAFFPLVVRQLGKVVQHIEQGHKPVMWITPLSAISDEQRLNAVLIFHNERPWIKSKICREDAVKYTLAATEIAFLMDANVRQYYINEGIAVPLFIEVGHPDNGRTAIELGIAIDKTTVK